MSAVWSVYLLRCRGGRLYTGISTDVARRYAQHVRGTGAKFTRAHPPEALLAQRACESRQAAHRLEYQIKRLSAEAKQALVQEWQAHPAAIFDADSPRTPTLPAASSLR